MAPRSARRATGVTVKAEAERALIVTGDACVLVWRTVGSSERLKSKQYRGAESHQ